MKCRKCGIQFTNRSFGREHELTCAWPPAVDRVERPAHYTATAVEPIDAIEAWGLGYHLGNVVKYVARHQRKGAPLEDLAKARWYLDRAIERMKREGGK